MGMDTDMILYEYLVCLLRLGGHMGYHTIAGPGIAEEFRFLSCVCFMLLVSYLIVEYGGGMGRDGSSVYRCCFCSCWPLFLLSGRVGRDYTDCGEIWIHYERWEYRWNGDIFAWLELNKIRRQTEMRIYLASSLLNIVDLLDPLPKPVNS